MYEGTLYTKVSYTGMNLKTLLYKRYLAQNASLCEFYNFYIIFNIYLSI